LSRLIKDALHQARWIKCKSNLFRRLDDGTLQFGTWHRTKEDLPRRQQGTHFLMPNQRIVEVGPHGGDDCNRRRPRCIEQQVDETGNVSYVSAGSLFVTG